MANVLRPEDWIIDETSENPFYEYDIVAESRKEKADKLDLDLILSTIQSVSDGIITENDADERMMRNNIDLDDFRRVFMIFKKGRKYQANRIRDQLNEMEEIL